MESRAFKILELIVDEYIRTGEPIGSKAVQEKLDINVSSATIRNEMAALEAQGYLEHPHTSAGRVPTFSGYRLYIEKMMPQSSRELPDEEKEKINRIFDSIDPTNEETIIESATTALAEYTKCAIVSTNALNQFSVITKVDVIPTGKRMYVLLLITSSGNIKNKVCRLSFDLTNEQMEFFTRFVNDNLKGQTLQDVSDEYMKKMSDALGTYMLTLSPLLKAVVDISAEMLEEKVNIAGEANLITCDEIESTQIAKIIESKNEFTQVLDAAFSGINVLFGGEDDTFVVSNTSLVTGSFNKGESKVGSFGVIGPVRLDYKKIIPYIEYFTEKVTNMLSQDREDDDLRELEKEVNDIE